MVKSVIVYFSQMFSGVTIERLGNPTTGCNHIFFTGNFLCHSRSPRKPPLVNRSKLTERRLPMDHVRSLTHTVWDCKDHLVWIPKFQTKVLYEQFIRYLGPIFKEISRNKEVLFAPQPASPHGFLILIRKQINSVFLTSSKSHATGSFPKGEREFTEHA